MQVTTRPCRNWVEMKDGRKMEVQWGAIPPDALLMSKVSWSVRPPAVIKVAPWGSQHAASLFSSMDGQAYLQLAWWRGDLWASCQRTDPQERSLESKDWRNQSPPQRSCRRDRKVITCHKKWQCMTSGKELMVMLLHPVGEILAVLYTPKLKLYHTGKMKTKQKKTLRSLLSRLCWSTWTSTWKSFLCAQWTNVQNQSFKVHEDCCILERAVNEK